MPLKYSCFISYCHGQGNLMKSFIDQLKKALEDYLEPWLDEKVFIDEDRLQPGYHYNDVFANAICQSICMIVVYSPKYERHSYCLREYQAMESIEKKRLELLGDKSFPGQGMIIPIIFRGEKEDIPLKFENCIHYSDFSKFTLASVDINTNPEFIIQIEKIAKYIYKCYKNLNEQTDICSECNSFKLPTDEEIQPWREQPKKQMVFPGREVRQ